MSDERFDRLDEKLEKVVDRLNSIDVTLTRNTVSLEEHVKRTTQLENRVQPIEEQYLYMIGVKKFIVVISIVVSIAVGIYELIFGIHR